MARVGIIGIGNMGMAHASVISSGINGVSLVAVADADAARSSVLGAGITRYEDGTSLINDPAVDAVIIASPDSTHETFVLAALDAGKQVLCEKPLATTVDGCRRILDAEAMTGRSMVQVGYMRRFDPLYRSMKSMYDGGDVGAARVLHCVHRNVSSEYPDAPFAPILNSAVHEIDSARWLLGSDVTRVVCSCVSRQSGTVESGSPRLVILETADGVLVEIEIYLDAGYGYDVRCELVGASGTLSLGPVGSMSAYAAGVAARAVAPDYRVRFADAYRNQMVAWLECLAGGERVGATTWDGYLATLVAYACVRSEREGRPVDVPVDG